MNQRHLFKPKPDRWVTAFKFCGSEQPKTAWQKSDKCEPLWGYFIREAADKSQYTHVFTDPCNSAIGIKAGDWVVRYEYIWTESGVISGHVIIFDDEEFYRLFEPVNHYTY